MSEELKPCPFCGGAATVKRNSYGSYYAVCNSDDCLCVAMTIVFATEFEAVTAWNRRDGENHEPDT